VNIVGSTMSAVFDCVDHDLLLPLMGVL